MRFPAEIIAHFEALGVMRAFIARINASGLKWLPI